MIGKTFALDVHVSWNGRKPGITTAEILDRGPKVIPKFVAPAMAPTPDQRKKMVSLALKGLILASLKNNMFSFNDKIYLQNSGGAIGVSVCWVTSLDHTGQGPF